jgi:glucosyl-3-phosphoglycerate synthase
MARTAAARWESERSFHHSLYTPARIAAQRECGVSVCLPSRECASTVGEIVRRLCRLRDAGAIDEIVVVDGASGDGTATIAERAGACVVQEAELMPSFGPVLGKGDAMWRALSVLSGEVVVYLDADSAGFSEHFATGLLGPLVCEPGDGSPPGPHAGRAQPSGRHGAGSGGSGVGGLEGGIVFVKAFYRRPFEHEGISLPEGGGRVNHLMARPALRLFYPELAGVRQPLAGEVAARRELLERIPFATGYGVEIAMLIDVWREVGLGGMAQVDLEEHRNRHQPLAMLSKMAETVLLAIVRRVVSEGRLLVEGGGGVALGMPGPDFVERDGQAQEGQAGPVLERPPMAAVMAR